MCYNCLWAVDLESSAWDVFMRLLNDANTSVRQIKRRTIICFIKIMRLCGVSVRFLKRLILPFYDNMKTEAEHCSCQSHIFPAHVLVGRKRITSNVHSRRHLWRCLIIQGTSITPDELKCLLPAQILRMPDTILKVDLSSILHFPLFINYIRKVSHVWPIKPGLPLK